MLFVIKEDAQTFSSLTAGSDNWSDTSYYKLILFQILPYILFLDEIDISGCPVAVFGNTRSNFTESNKIKKRQLNIPSELFCLDFPPQHLTG